MAGAVKFEGQPHFSCRKRRARRRMYSRTVVTLYSEVEGQGPGLVSIVAQMTPDVALALATQLTHAGLAARARGFRPND
jgi:hypothetical protein